ncbi:MAG: translation initiation factor [Deltaproteobacteria bacterium]|nr:translation initiation factor [Deltaproteobacteria bacterium]
MKKGSYVSGPSEKAGDAKDTSPFAALAALRASLPEAPTAPAAPAAPVAKSAAKAPPGPAKAVVRLERKGRGGKDVTLVEQLGLPAAELELWTKALKGQLGCGGTVEGDAIVLQGDLRKRLEPILKSRGVRQVKIG